MKKVWKNTVLLSMWKSALASGTFVFGKILFEPDITVTTVLKITGNQDGSRLCKKQYEIADELFIAFT